MNTFMKKCFTLIELMVVMAIIGLLATIILVSLSSAKERAKRAVILQFSASIDNALGAYAVGKWNFDEGSGIIAKDSSGFNNHGNIYNATPRCASANREYTPSGTGCSLEFTGVLSSYVEILDSPDLYNKKITIQAWIRPSAYSLEGIIVCKRWMPGYFFRLYQYTGRIEGYVHIEGDSQDWRGCVGPEDKIASLNKWSHVVLTYDGSAISVYLNSEKICSEYYAGEIGYGDPPIRIGSYLSGTGDHQVFTGLIDEVMIYDQPLSSAQIKKLYVEGLKKLDLSLEGI